MIDRRAWARRASGIALALRRRIDTPIWDASEWTARRFEPRGPSARTIRRSARELTAAQRRLNDLEDSQPSSLLRFERSVHSQNGEDGIVSEIFRRIGETNRHAIEIGAADGVENCSAALIDQGWSGTWIEGDPAKARQARDDRAHADLTVIELLVDTDSILPALERADAPHEPDLLVIDIDGNDFWLWDVLGRHYRPRVVVVEYNAAVGPLLRWVQRYDALRTWNETRYHGAGLAAMVALGRSLGYRLVCCESRGINAFFVRDEDFHHFEGGSVRTLFVPQRFQLPDGHPRRTPQDVPVPPFTASEGSQLTLEVDALTESTVRPGDLVYAAASVHNGSLRPIGAPGAHPIQLAAVWSVDGETLGEPARCVQAWAAEPGGTAHLLGRAKAPSRPGIYWLGFRLVQEGVRWFDQTVAPCPDQEVTVVDELPTGLRRGSR